MNAPRQDTPHSPLPRTAAELGMDPVRSETVLRLPGARVVFADHELLQNDFPQLRDEALDRSHVELQSLTGADRVLAQRRLVKEWLRFNVAFISQNQVAQTLVNTPIEVGPERVTAFRPPRYGRAMVFSVAENRRALAAGGGGPEGENEEGLLDVKGCGVGMKAEPSFKPHGNGLMKLGDTFREVIFQKLLGEVFRSAGHACSALPIYGVLDLGFDVKTPRGESIPAGMLVRRAHRRPVYPDGAKAPDSPLIPLEMEIEFLLRRHGITSVSPATTIVLTETDNSFHVKYGYFDMDLDEERLARVRALTGFGGGRLVIDGVNLQFTDEVERADPLPVLLDFGGYFVRESFDNPIVSLVSRRLLRLSEIIRTDDPRFTQPDEERSLLKAFRRLADTGRELAWPPAAAGEQQNLDPRLLADNLARGFRAGQLTGAEVYAKIEDYHRAWASCLSTPPAAAPPAATWTPG